MCSNSRSQPADIVFLDLASYLVSYLRFFSPPHHSHTHTGQLIRPYWFEFQFGGGVADFYQYLLTRESQLQCISNNKRDKEALSFFNSTVQEVRRTRDTEVIYQTDRSIQRYRIVFVCASCMSSSIFLWVSPSRSPTATHTHWWKSIVTFLFL